MIYFILGSPCNNYQGYCDVFKRCRGVDAEGPLSRLNKTLLSNETLTDTGDWIKVSEQFFILKK
jgi:disintegrin and metalloproteinase domain-containing protein 10